jgi:hypothetical protein
LPKTNGHTSSFGESNPIHRGGQSMYGLAVLSSTRTRFDCPWSPARTLCTLSTDEASIRKPWARSTPVQHLSVLKPYGSSRRAMMGTDSYVVVGATVARAGQTARNAFG